MTPKKASLTRLGLGALYASGIYRLLEPAWRGVGVIFTLHHIVPERSSSSGFAPNRILDISTDFLERTIQQVRALGLDIVDLDEARRRLMAKEFGRRFVCFTLDDGYQDNYTNAYPVFIKHNAPFTIYVTTGLPESTAILWWMHLEEIVRQEEEIDIVLGGKRFAFSLGTDQQKYRCFSAIYWHMRGLPQAAQQEAIAALVDRFSLDPVALCQKCAMTWEMLGELSRNDLVTIGAHTVNHFALSKLNPDQLVDEVTHSRSMLEARLSKKLRHFTYPFGDAGSAGSREFEMLAELGFATSTTTRKGMLFPEHAEHLQALPRVSLNGDYQQERYVRLFLSGAPFALWNRFRRLDVV